MNFSTAEMRREAQSRRWRRVVQIRSVETVPVAGGLINRVNELHGEPPLGSVS